MTLCIQCFEQVLEWGKNLPWLVDCGANEKQERPNSTPLLLTHTLTRRHGIWYVPRSGPTRNRILNTLLVCSGDIRHGPTSSYRHVAHARAWVSYIYLLFFPSFYICSSKACSGKYCLWKIIVSALLSVNSFCCTSCHAGAIICDFFFCLGRRSCVVVKAVSLLAVNTPLFCSIEELWSFRRVFENNGEEIRCFSCFWCVLVLTLARNSVSADYCLLRRWLRWRFDYVSWCNVIYPLMHVGVDTLERAQARSVENTWDSVVRSGFSEIPPTWGQAL